MEWSWGHVVFSACELTITHDPAFGDSRNQNRGRLYTGYRLEHSPCIKCEVDVIRALLLRAFGGAIAPTKASGLPRRYFALMATETTLAGQGENGGTMHRNGVPQENGKRRKLHGRAFYESIGSPKLVLAPMVEQSEFVCLVATS